MRQIIPDFAFPSPSFDRNTPWHVPSWLSRGSLLLTLTAIASLFGLSGIAAEPVVPSEIRFNEHIRPIFNTHCTACHGGVKQAGEVSFVYRDSVLPPNGWVIEPGDPEASILIERVTSEDADSIMPPPEHGDPLSEREIALLTQWINEGAAWSSHWAFEKPAPYPAPDVSDAEWSRQKIDSFLLAEMESAGVSPADDERPTRWLRRASLDLIGLPPSPEEQNEFLEQFAIDAEGAYEKAVSRLLKSPHFGERWASVWLDQVRYADSKGLGVDGRRNVWKYRDWVISALNNDLPYDEFTIKQIAGDLLPEPSVEDLVATAAHRLSQTNEEGGTDDEEFRVAAVIDRVSTTWQVWQGVTFGCVQCHSHPYDPIEQEEFYRFAAFFNNTADTDLDEDWPLYPVPVDPADYQRAAELDHKIAALRRKIWRPEYEALTDSRRWQAVAGMQASTNNATQVEVEDVDGLEQFRTRGTVSKNTDITLEVDLPASMQRLTAIRLTSLPLDPDKAVSDSEWGFVLSNVQVSLVQPDGSLAELPIARIFTDDEDPFYDPQESLKARSNGGYAVYTRIHYPRRAALVLSEPAELSSGARLRVELKHRRFILSAFPLIIRRGHLAVSDDEGLLGTTVDDVPEADREELTRLQEQRDAIDSTGTPVLQERPDYLARPTHVFVRGLFLTKDKQVTADVPACFPELPESDKPADRLALANWIVSDENPLTARVAVNRVWARVFGTGIVATEEDFGSSGEPPSHPALLDDLAWRFQNDMQWSFKSLLRELILSRAYRQSSRLRPEVLEVDANNRLLTRGPRHRLTAEMVRDQALAISGLLDDRQFGPPVHPPIPEGVWTPFVSGDKWNTPDVSDPNRYRRSIYTYTKRSIPYPMFASFDAPSREFCAPRRLASNTPLQALMTLNDKTFEECAQGLATRMATERAELDQQIRYGFQLATGRTARDSEIADLKQIWRSESGTEYTDADKLKLVAKVLLNLDEVLTK